MNFVGRLRSLRLNSAVAKNGLWGVATSVAIAVSAAGTVPIIARSLSTDEYSAWVIALQITGYLFLLQPAINTTITRLRGSASSPEEIEEVESVAMSATVVALGTVVVGGLILGVVAWFLPNLFPSMRRSIVDDARMALLIVGFGILAMFPSLPWAGILAGRMEGYRSSAAAFAGRFAFLLIVVGLGIRGELHLISIAVAAATSSLVTAWITLHYGLQGRTRRIPRFAPLRTLLRFAGRDALTALSWGWSIYVIGNVDLVVVGRLDYPAAGPYSLAATAAALYGTVIYQLTNASLPRFASGGREGLRELVVKMGRAVVSTSSFLTALIFLVGPVALGVLIPHAIADRAIAPLYLLMASGYIRHNYGAIVIAAYGAGLRRPVVVTTAVEAAANLAVSIVLGLRYGAPGVAAGTLVGGFVGCLTLAISLRRAGQPGLLPAIAPSAGDIVCGVAIAAVLWLSRNDSLVVDRGALLVIRVAAIAVIIPYLGWRCVKVGRDLGLLRRSPTDGNLT